MDLEFITIPLVVGICVAGTYGLFELYARRKERLHIIEKVGDKLDASTIDGKLRYSGLFPKLSFSSLKAGCLLSGIGLGLLVGLIINTSMMASGLYQGSEWGGWYRHEVAGTAYGASVLLFGGLGLIIAFVIEMKQGK
ncbi:MAG: hypothetical protein LBQ65_01730, partial [Tannerellaceae bacterium]|nr:hypothetical protein [Tannerellaceae bacterium]